MRLSVTELTEVYSHGRRTGLAGFLFRGVAGPVTAAQADQAGSSILRGLSLRTASSHRPVTGAGERRKARLAAGQPDIRPHLGCGGERKAGWLNIDLLGDPVDVAWKYG